MSLSVTKDFPLFGQKRKQEDRFIYFDTAATSQKPLAVIKAMNDFYLEEYATVHRAIYDLAAEATEKYASIRQKVADFIHAPSEETIVFTSGTTDGINLIAHCFCKNLMKKGDEILITEAEHHSNIVPWQMVAKEKGLILKVVPILEDGQLDRVSFRNMLSSKVKLVSMALMTNTTGVTYPIKEIVKEAHQVGAVVLVDAAQAAGHKSIDVQELNCDFLVFSGHKIYGPTGVGVLYGRYELLEKMPPYKGGGDMIEQVMLEKSTYQKPPLRFEAGTPMIAQVIGLGAAIDYLQTLGFETITKHEEALGLYARAKLATISGLKIIGTCEKKGSIITFVVEGIHPLDLGTVLNLKGICIRTGQMCAAPLMERFGLFGACRISFGVYNTLEEIDQFFHLLKEAIALLQPVTLNV